LFHYEDFDDFYKHIPYNSKLVGVELDDRAEKISEYIHTPRAVYLLGAEDNGLPPEVLDRCHELVQLPGSNSLNVAVAGSIVMHDRISKIPTKLP
jgi:tRNA G18 (ribose-2'-O)-methylase SpoU